MKSWKTTLGGLLLALGQVIAFPEPWGWVNHALTAIGGLLMGTAARDNSVTSEEAGAK